MSVSNVFYETIFFSPIIPTLLQFRAPHQEYRFDGQNIMLLDSHETLARTSSLTQFFNSNPHMPKGLDSREVTRTTKSSCLFGLTSGIAASFLLKNPFPLLMGLSECFPRAYAQQKVGNEFQVNSYTNNTQRFPSVASFSNGNFVVTWTSFGQDGSVHGVYGQLFDGNSSNIGSEFQVNTYTNSHQWFSSVASFSNGNFVVTWESLDQDGSGTYGQLFDGNGSNIGSEFRVNSYTTNNQDQPSVASLTNGNFVVTWSSDSQDGSGEGVYGQLFNGNGTKIGSEFQVNTYTTRFQWKSSVASLADANFVVTWESEGQDGSSEGVYGQIFHDNITYPLSSTTSTTKTSFTDSSVSSNTMTAIGQTRTSVNATRSWATVPSTSRPRTTNNIRATLSATSDPSSRFSWIWFLLGGVGAIFCLGLTGYLIFKSRKKDGNVHAFELGERKQTGGSTADMEHGNSKTPDFVTAGSEEGGPYARTPDFVTAAGEGTHYARTPDFVTAGAEEGGPYARTPNFVTAENGRDY